MTVDLFRAFAEVTHEALKRAETAETELADCQQRAAKFALDLRSAEDRIARQERIQTDSDTLVRRLRDTDPPASPLNRAHTGPPGHCQCGMVHGHDQAIQLTAGRDRIEKNT